MLLRMCARFARAHPRARVLYVAERGAMDRARIHASRAELSSEDARALERIGIKYARDDEDASRRSGHVQRVLGVVAVVGVERGGERARTHHDDARARE